MEGFKGKSQHGGYEVRLEDTRLVSGEEVQLVVLNVWGEVSNMTVRFYPEAWKAFCKDITELTVGQALCLSLQNLKPDKAGK